MVERLLDLSALERGDWTPESCAFDVATLVGDALTARRAEADRRGLTLGVVGTARLARRLGDRAGLRRVLLELVDNALRFTTDGGVMITLEDLPHEHVRFEVIDTGVGVPESAQGKLFGLFSQVDDSLTRVHDGPLASDGQAAWPRRASMPAVSAIHG